MRRILTISLALLMAVLPALAIRPQALPDFSAVTPDGATLASRGLAAANDQWLIVYVQPKCSSCETLLHLLRNPRNHAKLVPRVVIIGEGMTLPELRRLRAQHPALARARWYATPAKELQRKLRLGGSPVTIGMSRNNVRWAINGLLDRNGTKLRTIMLSWTR